MFSFSLASNKAMKAVMYTDLGIFTLEILNKLYPKSFDGIHNKAVEVAELF